jgi:hypothetical protein
MPRVSWPPYQGAGRCTGHAQPGATALMEVLVKDYGARNLGIYNCRSVRGSTNRSLHGEGRALDPGYTNIAAGNRVLQMLLDHRMELGIQLIIWNRRIYSAKAPLGARYQGVNPHTDHLHVELTWAAAKSLTVMNVRRLLAGTPPPYTPPKVITPPKVEAPQPAPVKDDDMGMIYRFPTNYPNKPNEDFRGAQILVVGGTRLHLKSADAVQQKIIEGHKTHVLPNNAEGIKYAQTVLASNVDLTAATSALAHVAMK